MIFVGSVRRDRAKRPTGLNWHGPDPLILHFHLDLAPNVGARLGEAEALDAQTYETGAFETGEAHQCAACAARSGNYEAEWVGEQAHEKESDEQTYEREQESNRFANEPSVGEAEWQESEDEALRRYRNRAIARVAGGRAPHLGDAAFSQWGHVRTWVTSSRYRVGPTTSSPVRHMREFGQGRVIASAQNTPKAPKSFQDVSAKSAETAPLLPP